MIILRSQLYAVKVSSVTVMLMNHSDPDVQVETLVMVTNLARSSKTTIFVDPQLLKVSLSFIGMPC